MIVVSEQGVALPFEQHALLWSMRVWVIGWHHDIQAADRIQDMMERLGADGAAPYLDEFMTAMAVGARRRIGIHCACHPRVEIDEQTLLNVLSFAQEGRSREALLLLRSMVRDDAAPAILRHAVTLGTELALACQFLPAPSEDACASGQAGSGPTTIH